jgi:hypothetical protein
MFILGLTYNINNNRITIYVVGQALERALIKINREDVVKKCIYNVENVVDEVEAAAARVAMDQSGI